MRQRTAYDAIRSVLAHADSDAPLTAREILDRLAADDIDIESTHRVATILGRRARHGDVEVVEDRPYRYHL